MIPKKIHYIIENLDYLTESEKSWIDTNRKLLKGFEFKIWSYSDFDLEDIPEDQHKNYTIFKTIQEHGGFCIDKNIIFKRKKLEKYLDYSLVICLLNNWVVSNDIVGGVKNSRICLDVLQNISKEGFELKTSLERIFGKYSIKNVDNDTYKSSKFLKILERGVVEPTKKPKNSLKINCDYVYMWDNHTSHNYDKIKVDEV